MQHLETDHRFKQAERARAEEIGLDPRLRFTLERAWEILGGKFRLKCACKGMLRFVLLLLLEMLSN